MVFYISFKGAVVDWLDKGLQNLTRRFDSAPRLQLMRFLVDDFFSVIVTDTSPLITLAMAGELNLLVKTNIEINIPDVVFQEATNMRSKSGASRIVGWINKNHDKVRIIPTETGIDRQRRIEEGRSTSGFGERSAFEVLDTFLEEYPNKKAILLFEDSDVKKRRNVPDERIFLLNTIDFLKLLESANIITNSHLILQRAAKEGRQTEVEQAHFDEKAKEHFKKQLTKRFRPC